MSRTVTPSTPQTTTPQVKVPTEKVAMRAYEKWLKHGCQHGRDVQDWMEAEAELRAEATKSPSPGVSTRR